MTNSRDDSLFAEDIAVQTQKVSEDTNTDKPDVDVNDLAELQKDDAVPEGESEEAVTDEAQQTISALREEIAALKAEMEALEQFKKNQDRILNELADFAALFPEVAVDDIPEEVWQAVRKGTALTASYALYEKRKEAEAMRVANINTKNASRSPGAAGTNTAGEYFTPDEVRRMSRAEVHANYSKIKESMKKWM